MQRRFPILVVVLCVAMLSASIVRAADIIPMPTASEAWPGTFTISTTTKIIFSGGDTNAAAKYLRNAIKERTGLELEVAPSAEGAPPSNAIALELKPADAIDGSYALKISPTAATISSSNSDGIFYGSISLLQLMSGQTLTPAKTIAIPATSVTDQPRYPYRGLMIDESRHFFGKKAILDVLDSMAWLKLNRFHWHLTDEDAWRIEIKKYPKLMTIGATGNRSDPDAPPLFYTQDEIREIVAYAASRHIIVVPEIDMPGHMAAVSRAYPELSGGGRGFTINPGKEETYTFCTDVLTEILPLFPGPYLHIGGDEVSFGSAQWDKDPAIVKFASDHGMAHTKDLEKYFVHRMNDVVHKLGKTTVAWDDAAVGIDNQNSVLMWWHDKHPEKLLANNYQLVLCPHRPVYFNSRQDPAGVVLKNRPVENLDDVYAFPESVTQGLIPPGKEGNVLGIQACLWSEFIGDEKRVNYMLYPRLAALAEDAWTPVAIKNKDDFTKRIPSFLKELDRRGLNYFDPFNPASTPEVPPPVIVKVVPRGHMDTADVPAPTTKLMPN